MFSFLFETNEKGNNKNKHSKWCSPPSNIQTKLNYETNNCKTRERNMGGKKILKNQTLQ